jgi:hypothetical protein
VWVRNDNLYLQASQQGGGMPDSGLNSVEQLVTNCIIRSVQCGFESQLIGRTVAFEDQAAQPQQGRAVVTSVIYPGLECG